MAGYSALDMEAAILSSIESAEEILRRVVSGIERERERTVCHFNNGGSILLSNSLGTLIQSGNEINFPWPTDSAETGSEVYVHKTSLSGRSRDLCRAPISYPKHFSARIPKSEIRTTE